MRERTLSGLRLLAPLAVTLAAGCASAYHSYSGCRVPCRYCAPPPLPYPHYSECVCHSHAGLAYLSENPQPAAGADEELSEEPSQER